MDPWKALVIHWDPDTPPNWPQRISPWEVRPSLSRLICQTYSHDLIMACEQPSQLTITEKT